ncbi:6604_t:CDS:2 [Rhizophagus irregularis]|nr:6604_t:CDS:2 [Rhizophagus irregularis]
MNNLKSQIIEQEDDADDESDSDDNRPGKREQDISELKNGLVVIFILNLWCNFRS